MTRRSNAHGSRFRLSSPRRGHALALGAVAAAVACSALTGCGYSHGRAMPAVKLDARASTDAAMEAYDTDGDGVLNREELSSTPALGGVVAVFDADGDSNISRDELFNLLESVTNEKPRILSAFCMFSLDGRPLSGAKVVFEPADFVKGNLLPATAMTSASGGCSPFIDPSELPKDLSRERGVRPGLYKVIVTHDQIDIPAKYNEETTLGLFLSGGTYPESDEFPFELKRK